MEDEIDEGPTPAPGTAAGYERRIGKLTRSLMEQRQRASAAEKRAETAEAQAAKFKSAVDTLKTEHAAALEGLQTEHSSTVQRMERTSALAAAGVDAEGHDVVLSAYSALGEDAPPLGEWLQSEGLPKHVSVYLDQGDAPKTRAPNPDAGTGARGGNTGGASPGFLSNVGSIEQLKAMKEAGQI